MFKDVGSQLHSPFFYDALHGKRLPNSRLSHLYAEKAGEYATERIENGPRLSARTVSSEQPMDTTVALPAVAPAAAGSDVQANTQAMQQQALRYRQG